MAPLSSLINIRAFCNKEKGELCGCKASEGEGLISLKNNENNTNVSTFLSSAIEKMKPINYYSNFKEELPQIKKDQSNQTGVYCLLNLINGNIYIGSSVNIANRMKNYSNTAYLKQKKNKSMPIIQALLKYGKENFAVLIVEHVSPKKLTIRETFYILELLPYYNVLKQGYSSLGYKHTEDTKHMLSELAKNRKHSDKTKALISKALIGENNPFYNKNHSFESKIRMIEANSAYPVYIYNSFKILLLILPSVKTLAKLIKSNHATIVNYIKKGELFRGEWYFTNIPFNISDNPLMKSWPVPYAFGKGNVELDNLIVDMIKNAHIKKAIFVYKSDLLGQAIEFVKFFEGVTHAQKELNIHHLIIKKHALNNIPYKNFIFSYERLQVDKSK
jgi:group I intron endonuclease